MFKNPLESPAPFYFALLVTIIPLWLVEYQPMVDLPQHVGQVAAMHEMLRGNQLFVENFEFNLFTPYLLGYSLLFLLNTILPMTLAVKVLVSAAIAAVPLSARHLLRELGADERLCWLTIPGAISFAFYWGLLAFLCAIPLGLYFIARAIRFERAPDRRQALILSAFSVGLFFSHILILIFSCAIALSYLFAGHVRRPKKFLRMCLPFATPLPLIVLWLISTYHSAEFSKTAPLVFDSVWPHFRELIVQPTGIDQLFLPLSAVITMALFVFPLALDCTLTRDSRRWAIFVVAMLPFLLLPHYALGTALLYERFGVFVLPGWLLLWNRSAEKPNPTRFLPLIVIVGVGVFNMIRFTSFERETRHFADIIQAIEPGCRVASVVLERNSIHFYHPVYLHHAVWYQAIKKGIVDFNFANFFPQLVHYKDGRRTAIDDEFAWEPMKFSWDEFDGDRYDYFLVLANEEMDPGFFDDHSATIQLVNRSSSWWLYENKGRFAREQRVCTRSK